MGVNKVFMNNQIMKREYDDNRIISFPGGATYDYVINTRIHAHPVKRGFPSIVSRFLMVRAKGGISHALYEVVKAYEFDPTNSENIQSMKDEECFSRLKNYIDLRMGHFGFDSSPLPYRFYDLKTIYEFKPCYILTPNIQGYRFMDVAEILKVVHDEADRKRLQVLLDMSV